MRLIQLDHYAKTIRRDEHDMIKILGSAVEFRYLRRYMASIPGVVIEFSLDPLRRMPQRPAYDSDEVEIQAALERRLNHLFDTMFVFLLRVYRDPTFMSSREYKELKDQLMLFKLSS